MVLAVAAHENVDGERFWQELAGSADDAAPALGLYGRGLWHLVIQKRLSMLTGTASVERWLNQISLTEMKHRANQLHIYNLECAVKLCVQSVGGKRSSLNPDLLFDGRPEDCKASRYGTEAARLYAEWFGEKARGGRSEKPSLGNMRVAGSNPLAMTSVLRNHNGAVAKTMAALGSASSTGASSSSGSSLDKMVAAIDNVAAARKNLRRASSATSATPCPDTGVDRKKKRKSEDDDAAGSVAKKIKLPDIESQQAAVAAKQLEAAKDARPGCKITYVDARGGMYKELNIHTSKTARRPEPRLPLVGVRVYLLDCKIDKLAARFRQVEKVRSADVLVVKDVPDAMYTVQCFRARLYGLRVADLDWLQSNGSSGMCLCFEPALQSHLHLWLSAAFMQKHKDFGKVLLKWSFKVFQGYQPQIICPRRLHACSCRFEAPSAKLPGCRGHGQWANQRDSFPVSNFWGADIQAVVCLWCPQRLSYAEGLLGQVDVVATLSGWGK